MTINGKFRLFFKDCFKRTFDGFIIRNIFRDVDYQKGFVFSPFWMLLCELTEGFSDSPSYEIPLYSSLEQFFRNGYGNPGLWSVVMERVDPQRKGDTFGSFCMYLFYQCFHQLGDMNVRVWLELSSLNSMIPLEGERIVITVILDTVAPFFPNAGLSVVVITRNEPYLR